MSEIRSLKPTAKAKHVERRGDDDHVEREGSDWGPLVFGNAEGAMLHLRAHARAVFEREKACVVGSLLESYRQQWGKLYEHDERLVVVKSPYEVPMGAERSMWMAKYAEV
jgi:hypothetical protein